MGSSPTWQLSVFAYVLRACAVYGLHQRGKELPVQSYFQCEKTAKEYGHVKAAPGSERLLRRTLVAQTRKFKNVVLWRRGRESKVDCRVAWMTNCKQRRETCVVFILLMVPGLPSVSARDGELGLEFT